MEREQWKSLYALAERLGKQVKDRGRFTTAFIVGVFLWSAIHDRPVAWSCRPQNWPDDLRPSRLPSQSTMSRRLRAPATILLLSAMATTFQEPARQDEVQIIDAKPLTVGGYTKDFDARWGRAAGGQWIGYKFFAIWGRSGMPVAWQVASMSTSEKRIARELIPQLRGSGHLLGDNQYDVSYLYDLAARQGYQLLAPRGREGGLGHHYQSPHRIFAIGFLQTPKGRKLFGQRVAIERCFGNWTSFGGGLAPLPAWVRRPHRVTAWIHAKLLINAARIEKKLASSATAVA